jgi:hypothetical protein
MQSPAVWRDFFWFRNGLVCLLLDFGERPMNSYQSCINLCIECAKTCDYCASACLKEEMLKRMVRCIELDLQCAALCRTASLFMTLQSEHSGAICQLCADVCNACSAECSKHNMDHCKKCAEICHQCAEECANMVAA